MPFRSALFVFLASAALAAHASPAAAGEDAAATVKRLSQQFSDASASGDAAVLAKLLDDRVVFMNESGAIATKKDLVEGAVPPAKPVSRTLTQNDFTIELHGNVAVTSFTDDLKQPFFGQTFVSAFRSTEVWLRETDGWKMISSQTMEAYGDPPAVSLPDSVLAEYAGTYAAGPGYVVTIARDGASISASANGGKPVLLGAELADVFFIPGQRGRRIFQRDASGNVTGYVSRREGHDIVLTRTN